MVDGDVYTPLNRRNGRIMPHAVTLDHISFGAEHVPGGTVDLSVLFTEVNAKRTNTKVVVPPAPTSGHLKLVRASDDSKPISLLPSGGARCQVGPGGVWFGVWNGAAWFALFTSTGPPDDKIASEPSAT